MDVTKTVGLLLVLAVPACSPAGEDCHGSDVRVSGDDGAAVEDGGRSDDLVPPEDATGGEGDSGPGCVPGAERCGPGGVHQRCAGDGSGWADDPCAAPLSCEAATGRCLCPAGSPTTVTGRVLFPNGREPVFKARVYVPYGAPVAPPAGPSCRTCDNTTPFPAFTETAVDGTFRLENVPDGDLTLVVEKGFFQRTVTLRAEACVETPVSEESTRLPRNRGEGFLPSMAVVPGEYDRMEDVLREAGIDDGEFDFAGLADLLGDFERMMTYHIIFINCGVEYESIPASWRDNAFEYVRQGGRLYVTDLSYDLIEHAYPSLIDFAESDGTPTADPEELWAADCGWGFSEDGVDVPATVVDADLAAWLEVIGAATGGGISLRGFLSGWAVMNDISDWDRGKLWVEGHIPSHPWQCLSGDHPMTVTGDEECGKVLYTSYHTVEGGTGDYPQEKVLMFLILEIAACLDEIIPVT